MGDAYLEGVGQGYLGGRVIVVSRREQTGQRGGGGQVDLAVHIHLDLAVVAGAELVLVPLVGGGHIIAGTGAVAFEGLLYVVAGSLDLLVHRGVKAHKAGAGGHGQVLADLVGAVEVGVYGLYLGQGGHFAGSGSGFIPIGGKTERGEHAKTEREFLVEFSGGEEMGGDMQSLLYAVFAAVGVGMLHLGQDHHGTQGEVGAFEAGDGRGVVPDR